MRSGDIGFLINQKAKSFNEALEGETLKK